MFLNLFSDLSTKLSPRSFDNANNNDGNDDEEDNNDCNEERHNHPSILVILMEIL